ncbi:MAG: hypothetical protein ACTSYI_08140 [Promethearchaeota archaeon]
MNQKKTQNHISKKKRTSKKRTPKHDEGVPRENVLLKMSILSTKDESIKHQFLQAIGASEIIGPSSKMTVGVDFFISYYSTSKDYTFQIWLIGNATRFESLVPSFLMASWGVIYFYRITDTIKKKRLALMKSGVDPNMHILFVGYDAVLPANPEEIDQNILLIQTYFPACHSMYIAVDEKRPDDALANVLDELISFDAEF